MLIALGFHRVKEVGQHSHSNDPVPIHAIHSNILPYAIYRYVKVYLIVLHYVVLQYCYILIYCDSSTYCLA